MSMETFGEKTQKPETMSIKDAVDKVIKGEYVLAPFQRPDVWALKNQKSLIESLIEGIPIGNFLLKEYKQGTEKRQVPGIKFPNNEEDIKYLIIDGQQRLSFLSWLKIKYEDQNFKYGPSNLFFYNLKNGEILNNKIEKKEEEYLKEGIIIINKYFDKKYQKTVSKSIHGWKDKDSIKLKAIRKHENLKCVFTEEQRIVIIKATKEADEKFGFRLYEVVNKSGVKLKGIDYIEGALYQICPELFEKVNIEINNLIEIPSSEKRTSKPIAIKAFKGLFTRTIFTRTLIDSLFHTPNPEDRNNTKSQLYKLKEFEKVKTKNNKILNKNIILKEFEDVRKSFLLIKEILIKHLNFKDDAGVNNLTMITANALFRKYTKPNTTQIGHFIKWFILFHINGKPYLGQADYKLKIDCNAARDGDIKKLIDNLIKNLKLSKEKDLFFNEKTYINTIGKKIEWDYNNENKDKFLKKIHKFFAVLKNAKDWLHPLEISNIDVGHLDEHHIFPKHMFGDNKNLGKLEKRRRDNPANIAHLHYQSNGSKQLKEPPHIYLKSIKKTNSLELKNQQIPLTANSWKFNNYNSFIRTRIKSFCSEFNSTLKILNSDNWNKKINNSNSVEYFFKNIKNPEFDESQKIEYKETFCYYNKTNEIDKKFQYVAFKEICSFLNTNDGVLYLGIPDDRKNIKGLNNELDQIKNSLKKKKKKYDPVSVRDKFSQDFKNKFVQCFENGNDLFSNNIKADFIVYNKKKWIYRINISKVNQGPGEKIKMKKYYNMVKKEWRKDENDVMWAQRVGQSSEWGKV